MAADQPDRLAVEDYAYRFFTPGHVPYITFAGLVEGVLEDDMTSDERVAEIRLALAALDLVLAEQGHGYQVIPHGPAQPPYGSEQDDDEGDLDDDEREAIARESSLRTADVIARFLRGEY